MTPNSRKQEKHVRHFEMLSIIVPTYKEVENIEMLVESITNVMKKHEKQYEIIIVDDNSNDGSHAIVCDLKQAGHPVKIIIRKDERGLSSAVLRGFKEARGDLLACMDADLSHPPKALPDLIGALEDPTIDFVIGSRYVKGASTDGNWGLFRWINSKLATLMASPFTKVKDPMAGFFMLPKQVFKKKRQLNPIGYKIGLELIVKCGCESIREIPISFVDRKYGQSKLNLREQWNYIRHIKRLADFKLGDFSYFLQFCFVGSTGMLIDLFIYSLLLSLTLSLPISRAIGIAIAMTWNFWLNRRLTFSFSRDGNILFQFFKFIGSCLTGALVSWSIALYIPKTIDLFSGHFIISAILGIIAGTIVNFSLSKFWVFKRLKE